MRMFSGELVTEVDGVKIYEGDIVEYEIDIVHGPHEQGVGEVFYDIESGCFLVDRDAQYMFRELTTVSVVGKIEGE